MEELPPSEGATLLLEAAVGVAAGVDDCPLLLPPNDPLACRLVMLPRSLRIASTSCTPSGAFGFLSLIYRSRCRPREDEVKGC